MRKAYIVVDLGYGDQGKGTTVDYITRVTGASLIVRFNGGCQAAHHVVTADGRWHSFSQFGSGMFVDGTLTFLSKFVLVSPKAMLKEARHLEQVGVAAPLARTFVDFRAPIITPFHQATNAILELQRGASAHGSCGAGIGETMEDVINRPELTLVAGDLLHPVLVRQKLEKIKAHKWAKLTQLFNHKPLRPEAAQEIQDCFVQTDVIDNFVDIYSQFAEQVTITRPEAWHDTLERDQRPVVFEGAQGILLDELHGFHPHNTWSNTTFANADELLRDAQFHGEVVKVGVTRAYSTRHGAGPFVVEDLDMTRRLPEAHNVYNRWQGPMRAGWLDLVALRYAAEVAGRMDCLAVTCLDRVLPLGELKACTEYQVGGLPLPLLVTQTRNQDLRQNLTKGLFTAKPKFQALADIGDLLTAIQQAAGAPAQILSFGPTPNDKEADLFCSENVRSTSTA